VHVDGEVRAFGRDQTVILPRDQVHQIFNTGPAPLEILGVFGATPVKVFLPDATELAVPWRS
jgi:mannose-6-phosphate isomerase-like protein (cupin superfamily)